MVERREVREDVEGLPRLKSPVKMMQRDRDLRLTFPYRRVISSIRPNMMASSHLKTMIVHPAKKTNSLCWSLSQ